jgi:unsaturated rhamnogalacturonyl hydrolase
MKRFCLTLLLATCGCATRTSAQTPDVWTPAAVTQVLSRAADWQLANPGKYKTTDWTQGALYAGMTAWGLLADDSKYLNAMRAIGEANQWQPGPRPYHADDHCVGQMYLELYSLSREAKMMKGIRSRFEQILDQPADVNLKFGSKRCQDRWAWCDALFMSPTVWTKLYAVTGEKKYLDFMDREYWATAEYLYDREENLFYRDSRYFELREKNGKKMFWGRGNGWVFAGLAVILQDLPPDFPSRPRYETLFKEMAARLKALQSDDGYWRSSLLDATNYPNPETSGTGFFTYGLAWGINHGYLDRAEFLPAVRKGWQALTGSVQPDGKLIHVQPVGADPKTFSPDHSDVYAVGGFLLAGCEIYKLTLTENTKVHPVAVHNKGGYCRARTVELDLAKLNLPPQDLVVIDARTGRTLLHQAVDVNADGTNDYVLFQSSFNPSQTKTFWLLNSPAAPKAADGGATCFGRYVPERKDDFAWENDRIAFRMYGPALEADGEISSGLDVWVKSVRYPVVDRWYKSGDYHNDHGEGFDGYKVGPSRGCGGLAFWNKGELAASRNWIRQKLICAGPVRVAFELAYAPWKVGDVEVSETKKISLDRGSNLNRIESLFTIHGTNLLTVAVGIVKRPGEGEVSYNTSQGWVGYWEPADPKHGSIACGIVVPERKAVYADVAGHYLLTAVVGENEPFVHYAGAAWSRSGDFATPSDWFAHLREEAASLISPLEIVYLN